MPTFDQIQQEIRSVCDTVEEMGDSITPEMAAQIDAYLDELAGAEADKVDAFAAVVRREAARVEFLKSEADRVQRKRKSAESGLNYLKARYLQVMQENGLRSIKGNTSSISARFSQAVVVVDEARLPDEFVRTKREANKTEIGAALKGGHDVPGAQLVETVSLQVR